MLDTLSLMGAGFLNALTPINLLMMAAGVAMGIVIGCMPGLSAAMGVALMLPMTFTMKPESRLMPMISQPRMMFESREYPSPAP